MKLLEDLLESVQPLDHPVQRVCVGLHWTAVESRYVGMAHTYKTASKVELKESGNLVGMSAFELALGIRDWEPLEASVALAALNSLIEPSGTAGNVFDEIMESAKGRTVSIVGRFPANDQIARVAREAYFLEMVPQEGELPSYACEEVMPKSDLVVISATALINKTLPHLLELGAGSTIYVLGPSTPMNDILFHYGADVIAGVKVIDADALFSSLMQGVKKFRKIAGIEPIIRTRSR